MAISRFYFLVAGCSQAKDAIGYSQVNLSIDYFEHLATANVAKKRKALQEARKDYYSLDITSENKYLNRYNQSYFISIRKKFLHAFLILKISKLYCIHTCIVEYFSTTSLGSDVRPAFVKSTNVSLYIRDLFNGDIDETYVSGDFFVLFFPVIEETSEALSSNASSPSERYKSFPSLSS